MIPIIQGTPTLSNHTFKPFLRTIIFDASECRTMSKVRNGILSLKNIINLSPYSYIFSNPFHTINYESTGGYSITGDSSIL
jgi:hypothetical protein